MYSSFTKYGIKEFCDRLGRVVEESGEGGRKMSGGELLLERRVRALQEGGRATLGWGEFTEVCEGNGRIKAIMLLLIYLLIYLSPKLITKPKIARECSITSDSRVRTACKFLHDVGVLLHFEDPKSNLSDLIILSPQVC